MVRSPGTLQEDLLMSEGVPGGQPGAPWTVAGSGLECELALSLHYWLVEVAEKGAA